MKTKDLETLKIHRLSQAQYDREYEAGNIEEDAIYLTPDGSSAECIIDVLELPTEGINENAFYRVLTAKFLFGQFIKNDWILHVVETLPETGEMCWDGTTAIAYYSVASNNTYGYVDANVSAAMEVPVGWYTADDLIPAIGSPYGGIITDITKAVESTVYTYLQGMLYSYANNTWTKLDVIGWRGTGESSEIFNHLSNEASGSCSHAEGLRTTASGEYSHAEGAETTSSGSCSHAEGSGTIASESASHAEGILTTAYGLSSHAEGYYTTASHKSQHVHGECNIIEDQGESFHRGRYVTIVGNGTDDVNRSNAHTLDWNGVGWFKGGLQVGGTGQGSKDASYVPAIQIASVG